MSFQKSDRVIYDGHGGCACQSFLGKCATVRSVGDSWLYVYWDDKSEDHGFNTKNFSLLVDEPLIEEDWS